MAPSEDGLVTEPQECRCEFAHEDTCAFYDVDDALEWFDLNDAEDWEWEP